MWLERVRALRVGAAADVYEAIIQTVKLRYSQPVKELWWAKQYSVHTQPGKRASRQTHGSVASNETNDSGRLERGKHMIRNVLRNARPASVQYLISV